MDTTKQPGNQPGRPPRRRKSILWDGLNRGTAWLYATVIASRLGKLFTSYRRINIAISQRHRYAGRHRCSPMSGKRQQVVSAIEGSALYRLIRGLFRAMFVCPTACYGLFGLVYGGMGALAGFLAGIINEDYALPLRHFVTLGLIALLSLPLIATNRPFAQTLEKSGLGRLILVRYLGIPEDRIRDVAPENYYAMYFPAYFFGVVAAIASVFLPPLAIPFGILLFGVLGMILSYPETGVVLTALSLPLIWLQGSWLFIPVVLILVTWISYGIKVLFLHRPIRFGLLDRVMLVMGLVLLGACLTGAAVSVNTLLLSLCLLIFFSSYFLVVNLMTSRIYIRRCLVGVAISLGVVTALACLRLIPVDGLSWLEGSRAGDAIVGGFRLGMEQLSGLWAEHSELYLVLAFPWLYAYMLHTKRLFGRILGCLAIGVDLMLILMPRSISALFCVVGVTVLFLLLLNHTWLSAGIIALPMAGCGLYWISYVYPLSDALQTLLSRSRLYKSQLANSLWHMCLEHPAGIGAGEEAFAAVYPFYAAPDLGAVTDSGNIFFEILLSYGWPGLILLFAVFLLFLQKSFTCLRETTVSKDRAVILGGLTSIIGVTVFGTVRSFLTSPRVFFTIVLVLAICSAYENIIFDESDVLRARWSGSAQQEDRFYCKGRNMYEKE